MVVHLLLLWRWSWWKLLQMLLRVEAGWILGLVGCQRRQGCGFTVLRHGCWMLRVR